MKARTVWLLFGLAVMVAFAACAPAAESMTGDDDMGGMTQTGQVDMEALLGQGQQVYAENCAGCHGANGEGGFGVPHAGNANLADADFVIDRMLNGRDQMPAWGARLDDDQIAAAATYIRNSFGNDFGPVQPAQVAAAR